MNNLDLLALEYFVEVAQAGAFSTASTIIGVSQPTLSRHIKQLEEDLGTRLLERTGHGVQLTEAGEMLLRSSRKLLAHTRQVQADVADIGNCPSESVSLGLPPAAGRILSVPVAREFMRVAPSGKLRIVECFTSYLREWVMSGRIDIAIVYEDSVEPHLNKGELLWDERSYLIAPRDWDFSCGTIDFVAVAKIPLVLPSAPHGRRLKIDRIAAERHVQLDVICDVDGLSALLGIVRKGMACTILSRPALCGLPGDYDLKVIPIVNPIILSTAVLISSPDRPETNTSRKLVQVIRGQARKLRHQWLA